MKFERSKEWWLAKARREGDASIGAGLLARDPALSETATSAGADRSLAGVEEMRIAFSRFVKLMRRQRGLSVEKLADEAAVDIGELVSIEEHLDHSPEPRTIYQLARTFNVPQHSLMQLAGLTVANDVGFCREAVRFAARSETTQKLSPAEKAALNAFITVLSKQ
jgi:transcriptional regulator with XRE-family HTH domain